MKTLAQYLAARKVPVPSGLRLFMGTPLSSPDCEPFRLYAEQLALLVPVVPVPDVYEHFPVAPGLLYQSRAFVLELLR